MSAPNVVAILALLALLGAALAVFSPRSLQDLGIATGLPAGGPGSHLPIVTSVTLGAPSAIGIAAPRVRPLRTPRRPR